MSKKVYQVRIKIRNTCESFVGEPLYLAGSFNNWDPVHLYVGAIPQVDQELLFSLEGLEEGDLELKLSRGNWQTLTSSSAGHLVAPQLISIPEDSSVSILIEAWRDQFPSSTASPQVQVLDQQFFFERLEQQRKVWIYLPKDYATSTNKYPVIYMHDGQHLFDEATSVGRAGPVEWMVDKTIDQASIPAIVVGIDHADDYALRQGEYLVHPTDFTAEVQGWAYLGDIVHILKPYVDRHYRTLSDAAHTAMVGSSLGGLLTIYAGLRYPHIFGTIGAFSPSIWMDKELLHAYSEKQLAIQDSCRKTQTLYFYVGEKEQRVRAMAAPHAMKPDIDCYTDWLHTHFTGRVEIAINAKGKHGALYWQDAFRNFYAYWQTHINPLHIN